MGLTAECLSVISILALKPVTIKIAHFFIWTQNREFVTVLGTTVVSAGMGLTAKIAMFGGRCVLITWLDFAHKEPSAQMLIQDSKYQEYRQMAGILERLLHATAADS